MTSKSRKLKPHPLSALLPPMNKEEKQALLEDIRANKQREKILLYEGMILDGVHRNEAIEALNADGAGLTPRTTQFIGSYDEAKLRVLSGSVRRDLEKSQRAMIAADAMPALRRQASERRKQGAAIDATDDEKGEARQIAARRFRVSTCYVSMAEKIKGKAARDVLHGNIKLTEAFAQVKRTSKAKDLEEKAAAAAPVSADDCNIIHANWRKGMEPLVAGSIRLIATDPPYNNGTDYGSGAKADKLPPEKYLALMRACFEECRRVLTDDGALWVLIDDKWAGHFAVMLEELGFDRRAWIIWYETFGVNCSNNFNRCSRHLFYCVKDASNFAFHRDIFQRDSNRAAIYKDKRAANGGKKMWDSVWGIPGVEPHIPRIVGTANERVEAPTQVPLALMEPIIKGCSDPGDTVFDPFTGTGTTAVAAILNGRKFIGTEREQKFVKLAGDKVRVAVAERKQ